MYSKKKRIDIQRETIKYVDNNSRKFNSKSTKYDNVNHVDPKKIYDTTIEVSPLDTLEAVKSYGEKYGEVFSFLVMANATSPGGGYKYGSPAQEESICRRTNLPQCFSSIKYPISEYGCVHIKNIHIIRDTEENKYEFFKTPIVSNCILSAAYKCPETDANNKLTGKFREGTIKKIQNILDCFYENGEVNIVLGAYGCGAFLNPVEDIASIFKDILESKKYKNMFKHVVFAVLSSCFRKNYDCFIETFK